ncbi:MAG: IPT/TIG domain-containing protein [Actinobacteria bacterium]|nr:IPT/TIG domain-containing protein [Actinomycetota bacterium]
MRNRKLFIFAMVITIIIMAFLTGGCGGGGGEDSSSRITWVWPDTGDAGMEFKVTGQGFGDSQGHNYLDIGGEKAAIVEWSDTEITAEVPNGLEVGPVDVVVYLGGNPSNEFEFYVVKTK